MISDGWVICPLIRSIEPLNDPFGQQALEIAHEDDVILAVEVDPTVVALPGIPTLGLTSQRAIENIIQWLLMDVAQLDVKILAQRHIPIAVDDQTAHDALTTQF